ncbi:UTP--glucose-1-phosphate uridylyltransferase GalU [Candidatus Babeliales bacterium]|nr:UTP--glucose-1-phosphate uridylyltransferase GalU [Candidatus Babeliales bacterium]
MKVKKAIIPAAGLGTRFLPQTKSIPKEMLPLVDKPAIQYIVEEGIRSSIENFIVISGRSKKSLEDHFDLAPELENILESKSKKDLTSSIEKIIEKTDFTYVRQKEPLGLGHAIWTARHAVGREHVAILLPDDIITGPVPAISQLIKIATQEKCNVVAVREVPIEDTKHYGVVAIKKQFSPNLFQVKNLVEKPEPNDAPSNLAIIGRYVLSPNIFDAIEETSSGHGGEIQLTDAISKLLSNGEKVFAYKVQGTRYDVGKPLGWLKANISLALKHPDYGEQMLKHLKELDRDILLMEGKAEILSKTSESMF